MVLCISIAKDCFLFLNAYPPTLAHFNLKESLSEVADVVPIAERLFIMGGFNARVDMDHSSYKCAIGKGNKKTNNDLMLSFCTQQNLPTHAQNCLVY